MNELNDYKINIKQRIRNIWASILDSALKPHTIEQLQLSEETILKTKKIPEMFVVVKISSEVCFNAYQRMMSGKASHFYSIAWISLKLRKGKKQVKHIEIGSVLSRPYLNWVYSVWPIPKHRSVLSGPYPIFGLANTQASVCFVWSIPNLRSSQYPNNGMFRLVHIQSLVCFVWPYPKHSHRVHKNMQKIVWICSYCAEKGRTEDTRELKLFKRYVDDIVCTVKGNPVDYLESPNGSGDQAFPDLNINVNHDRKNSCHWHQKSTGTSINTNFHLSLDSKLTKFVFLQATSSKISS